MCGISGVIVTHQPPSAAEIARVRNITARLSHRGPDGDGLWTGPMAAFGHRRLAILDLSPGGAQPWVDTATGSAIAFNGELYNYVELREDLRRLGYDFRTASDTEVVLRAVLAWGADAFARMRGMWAFAVYDGPRACTWLSRDRFGIKPLAMQHTNNTLWFASEPQALATSRDEPSRANMEVVTRFLLDGRADTSDATFFAGIRHLPAATYLRLDAQWDGRRLPDPVPYWALPTHEVATSYADALIELQARLDDAMRLHLRADVPIGMCLSGGLDSSTLAGLMAKQLPAAAERPHAFTAVVRDKGMDESRYAAAVVDFARLRQTIVEPSASDVSRDMQSVIRAQGEPFGSTGVYLQWRLFQAIGGAGLKVVLDGQGADEVFGGYLSFAAAFLRGGRGLGAWRRAIDMGPALALANLPALLARFGSVTAVAGRVLARASRDHGTGMAALLASAAPPRPSTNVASASLSPMRAVLHQYLTTASLPALLRYEDRNSMAFSVEARVPFLDHLLVETALTLPDTFRWRGGYTKAILRDAARPWLPNIVRTRRLKLGFASPQGAWMRDALFPALPQLLEHPLATEVLDVPRVRRELSATVNSPGAASVRHDAWWRIYCVLRWAESCL